MSQFECSIKDLDNFHGNKEEIVENVNPKNILSKNQKISNVDSDTTQDADTIKTSLFDKITEEKNIRIILLTVLGYLVTSSNQFIELLGNSFPYLVDSGVANLSGKIVIATLIGLSVVLFISFFQVP